MTIKDNSIGIRNGKHYLSGYAPFIRKQISGVFFMVFFILALAACSAGNTAPKASITPTEPVHPTPTTLPSGTLLYQSDWSRGLDGWQGSSGWKVTHGRLQTDLSNGDILTSPYTPVVPNYAIEVRFQIVSVPKSGGNFVIVADKAPGKVGYTAGILNLLGPGPRSQFANPEVQVYLDPIDAMESSPPVSDYEPGSGVHTYRIEVQGPQVQFFIDDLRKSRVTSSQTDFLSNGPIHLRVDQAIVRVFSVRMTAL
jgi:hypothetical protein